MTKRWAARHAAIAAAVLVITLAFGSWRLFSSGEPPRQSSVAGSQTLRGSASDDHRVIGAIDDARREALRSDAPAVQPSVEDVLTWFDVLLHGPRNAPQVEPTVGEVLVYFNALLAEPGPTPPQPTVAETLIFFHALLYGGDPTDTPAAPAPIPPAPEPPVATQAPPRRATPAPPSTPVPPTPTAPAAVAPAPAAVSDTDVWMEASFTQAVWDGVNARRAQAGLATVANESRLHVAASNYAVVMAEQRWFSHTGPDGSSFVDRIVAAGFPFTVAVGEVLAMGSHGWPAADVVQAWIDSPPHREQLLNPAYTRAGLECAFSMENDALMVRCAMEFAAS